MGNVLILPGQRFGRWTFRWRQRINGRLLYLCRCDCGKEKAIAASNLIRGMSKSCGCLSRELGAIRATRHGQSTTQTYCCWRNMISRCTWESADPQRLYLARGIMVCDRWRDSFDAFLADMGNAPSRKHSIDRIDSNGHYEPGNCRWATAKEQARNRRSSRRITHEGETLTIAEWAEKAGLKYDTLHRRLTQGVPFHVAIALPVQNHRRKRMPRV